jgi:hypothetical protein
VLIHPLTSTTLRDSLQEKILAGSATSAHRIARSTSRAFHVLAKFASSDAVAQGSGLQLQGILRDAIEVISAWRGPPAERARLHLERMRELLDRSGLDGRLQPLAASVLKVLGLTEERAEGPLR